MTHAGIGVPARLIAGNSWFWTSVVPVVAGVDVALVLRPRRGGEGVPISTLIENGARVLRLPAAESAAVAPGVYQWFEVATRPADGARWVAGEGQVEILPDPVTGLGDLRTSAERILEAIEATIEGRATKDADAYSIEGRSITRTPMADLLRLRAIYRREVAAERGTGSGGFEYRRVAIK